MKRIDHILAVLALAAALLALPAMLAQAGHVDNPAGGQIVKLSASLTPAATAAAIQTIEQTFTVTGLLSTDAVIVNGPVPTSLCPPVTFRASAANTLAIGFSTLTAAACTPAAGTYKVTVIR